MENIEYISPENYKHQADIWYRTYNISREKLNLFHDFLVSLYELIDNTYMGSDIMIDEEDQKSHFNWCWDKIINDFSNERIYFKPRGNYHEYFWNFFLEAYYFTKIENKEVRILEYLYKLFDFNYIKTRSEMDMVTEMYKLLDQNLKK